MARINIVTPETANPEQQALYSAIKAQLGMVPNFLKVFANSPAALNAFLGLHSIAGYGSLDPLTRERVALALATQRRRTGEVGQRRSLGLCFDQPQRRRNRLRGGVGAGWPRHRNRYQGARLVGDCR